MTAQPTAHCLRCKTERPVRDARLMRIDNRRVIERAICVHCGTATSKFLKEIPRA